MKEESKAGLSITLGTALIMAMLLLHSVSTQQNGRSWIVFAAGTPDAYGNYLWFLHEQQLDNPALGAGWQTDRLFDNTTYTVNMSMGAIDSWYQTRFRISVILNSTMADNSTHAITNTRVWISIIEAGAPLYTNKSMTAYDDGIDGAGYYVSYVSNATEYFWPLTNTVYNITIDYDAYY